jgi:predicted nucleic acid-binding protein
VPDIFWAEVGKVLGKGSRQDRRPRSMAEGIAFEMKAQDFPTIPARALMPEALKIAFTYDRSVYECLYLAYLPVKWLGAL